MQRVSRFVDFEVGTRFLSTSFLVYFVLTNRQFCAFGVFSVPLYFSCDVRFSYCKFAHFLSLVLQISQIAKMLSFSTMQRENKK